MRKPPSLDDFPDGKMPEIEKKNDPTMITMVRHYELITPLFGGGVEASVVDTDMPIRGTTIRGQLRFWWRATRGAFGKGDAGLKALKAAEDAIWGSTEMVSPISIEVVITKSGSHYQPKNWNNSPIQNVGDPSSTLGYAAFPLRDKDHGAIVKEIEFELKISFPKTLSEDLQSALWAWDTFGGVGARTRRGFGALNCLEFKFPDSNSPDQDDWKWNYQSTQKEQLKQDCNRYVKAGNFHASLPHLSKTTPRIELIPARSSPIETLESLVKSYKAFRQKRGTDRRGMRFGRSKWPEPDAIRKATGQHSSPPREDHRSPIHGTPIIDKFPRAKFGLPIKFEFHDHDVNPNNPTDPDYDPQPTTLEPANSDINRFASPLIFRPLKDAGLALILEGPTVLDIPDGLELSSKYGFSHSPAVDLTQSEASRITGNGHPDLNNNPDVLQAFLDSLK